MKILDCYEWMKRDRNDPEVIHTELELGYLVVRPHEHPRKLQRLTQALLGDIELMCRRPRFDTEKAGAIAHLCRQHSWCSRILGHVGDLTLWQWSEILAAYEYRCAYCREAEFEEFEHIVPVSRGGGTTAMNVVPTCLSCNRKKHSKTPSEWFELMGINEAEFIAQHERFVRRIWSLP